MLSIEKIIVNLKSDGNYNFKTKLSNYDLICSILIRVIQFIRGWYLRICISGSGGLFIGKNVTIHYKKYVKIDRMCILEDNVYINGLSEVGINFGENVTVARGARLIGTGVIRNKGIGIKIGSNSAIGSNNFIGGQGGVEIGENVIMGPDVRIFSENHNIDKKDIAIKNQGESRIGVCISDDCWIGASVTILDGVKLSKGTVVAAGSVVTKSVIEPNMVIAGIPAKILKSRLQ